VCTRILLLTRIPGEASLFIHLFPAGMHHKKSHPEISGWLLT
jgi:hypothetical protein